MQLVRLVQLKMPKSTWRPDPPGVQEHPRPPKLAQIHLAPWPTWCTGAPKTAQVGPDPSNIGSTWPKIRPKSSQVDPKLPNLDSKSSNRHSKTIDKSIRNKGCSMFLQSAQNCSSVRPRPPSLAPSWLQDCLKAVPRAPKLAPRAPKSAQIHPT